MSKNHFAPLACSPVWLLAPHDATGPALLEALRRLGADAPRRFTEPAALMHSLAAVRNGRVPAAGLLLIHRDLCPEAAEAAQIADAMGIPVLLLDERPLEEALAAGRSPNTKDATT